jgi:hypothetical protein
VVQEGRVALVLRQPKPDSEATGLISLRFAFIARGPGGGDHIFPSFILDDWGREIRSLKLYEWVRENGQRFPRAEIFGFEQDGRETQCFLRELELYARLPCYAYRTADQPVAEGRLLNSILLPHDSAQTPLRIEKPAGIERPLRAARVTWWQIPTDGKMLDLAQLDARPDPGY